MSMKNIRSILILICLATVLYLASALARNRPNIVLFLADDMGYGELGCYGNADAITPNLDRFAAEGLRLTDCHAASSVCSPARSSLLTDGHRFGMESLPGFQTGARFIFVRVNRHFQSYFSKQGMTPAMLVSGISTDFQFTRSTTTSRSWVCLVACDTNNAAPSHAFPNNFVRNGKEVESRCVFSSIYCTRSCVMA